MVDVIEDIKENVEEGGEAIEELAEKGSEIAKKEFKKVKKVGKEIIKEIEKGIEKEAHKVKEVIKKDEQKIKELPREEKKFERREKGILRRIEESIEMGVKKVEETLKEDVEKVERVIKKDAKKAKKFLKEEIEKAKELKKKKIKISFEKEAELESSEEKIMGLEEKKRTLLEKAKKLKEKISVGEVSTEELKEKIKLKKRTDMLVPLEEYVKAGIYLGTRVVTPNMKQFVYRRRADGLAIFNTDTIDEKLKEGVEYLGKFAPEDVILICKRQAGWRAAEKFSEITGIRAFTKKYPAGILTNKQLPDFFENELTIITDQWVDKNALNDTLKIRKKVFMICDTNNFSQGANQIIIGNNKSPKSLGLIFYILARGYCKARGLETGKIPDLEWWTGELEETRKEKTTAEPRAEFGV